VISSSLTRPVKDVREKSGAPHIQGQVQYTAPIDVTHEVAEFALQ
jgi:hypothetical protein